MGNSTYDTNVYAANAARRAATGVPTFAYDASVKASGDLKVHPNLDPKWVNTAGQKIRESRDSDEHPTSRPVTVLLDVTGSNIHEAEIIHKELPKLMGILLRKGYAGDHPQVQFGAVGDAYVDRVPLQIGQWESDNRMDSNLEHLVLEGGGGGQRTESYELAAYFMARNTVIDSWEKRGEKGYIFFIGDEMPKDAVSKSQVSSIIGDTLEADIPTEEIFRELQERFHVYYLLPQSASYGKKSYGNANAEHIAQWRKLLGENVFEPEDSSQICEFIVGLIAVNEGFGVDEVDSDLADFGVDAKTRKSVSTALAKVGGATGKGALVRPEGGTLATTGAGSGRRI